MAKQRNRVNLTLDDELFETLTELSELSGTPRAAIINELLTEVKPQLDFNKYEVFYNSDPYFSYSLGFNLMNTKQNIPLSTKGLSSLSHSKNAVVIWESWYSPLEDNCSLETLKNNKDLLKIFELKNTDKSTSIAIFEPVK